MQNKLLERLYLELEDLGLTEFQKQYIKLSIEEAYYIGSIHVLNEKLQMYED